MKKAQTATEYLIILAVVIIIALIVVSVLGGIPGMGGSSRLRASSMYWSTAKIAFTSYAVGPNGVILQVRNNNLESITLNSILLDGNDLEIGARTLTTGESVLINSSKINCSSGTFSYDVLITYIDSVSGSLFTSTGNGQTLDGACASG